MPAQMIVCAGIIHGPNDRMRRLQSPLDDGKLCARTLRSTVKTTSIKIYQ